MARASQNVGMLERICTFGHESRRRRRSVGVCRRFLIREERLFTLSFRLYACNSSGITELIVVKFNTRTVEKEVLSQLNFS